MILGSGILTVFTKKDVSAKGEKPRYGYEKKTQAYYAELDYTTGATWTTQGREDVQIDARVRILQDRRIDKNDVIVLEDAKEAEGAEIYQIERAYHGRDEESGMLISDLSLRRVKAK